MLLGYDSEERRRIEELNKKLINETSELLDHVKVSYIFYDDSGEISNMTSVDIYSFSGTGGAEWYLDKIISVNCDRESCVETVTGPWKELLAAVCFITCCCLRIWRDYSRNRYSAWRGIRDPFY